MDIQTYHLRNNSLLVVVPIPQVLSATTMALVKAGPRYDPPDKEGLSHFVEHMLSQGSKKWPTSWKLASALERKGASDYSFSYYETNRYWIKSSVSDIDLAIENLVDRLYSSLLRESDIETEKGVVKEELRILQSNPEKLIWEAWSQTLWQGSDLGRTYIGSPKSIASFSKIDIKNFIDLYYIPQRIVFAVSGDLNPIKVGEEFNRYLSKGAIKTPTNYKLPAFTPVNNKKKKIKIVERNVETITVALGFPTVDFGHKDTITLELLRAILGDGMSSRLRQKVMKLGYTYSIETYTEHLSDCGYFMIKFTVSKKYLKRVLQIISEEIIDLTAHEVKENELSLAKGYLTGSLQIDIETSFDWAKWFVDQYLLSPNRVFSPAEKINQIKKINSKAIKKVAKKYFQPQNMHLAIVGKLEKEDITCLP